MPDKSKYVVALVGDGQAASLMYDTDFFEANSEEDARKKARDWAAERVGLYEHARLTLVKDGKGISVEYPDHWRPLT